MSFMFEVLSESPADLSRESLIGESVTRFGGCLARREEPGMIGVGSICLTYEFSDRLVAEQAASCLREHGEHVEEPVDYGD